MGLVLPWHFLQNNKHLSSQADCALPIVLAPRLWRPRAFGRRFAAVLIGRRGLFRPHGASAFIADIESVTTVRESVAMQGDRERCLAVGMDDYLIKPFKADTIHSIVDDSVQRRGVSPVCANRNRSTGWATIWFYCHREHKSRPQCYWNRKHL